MHPILGQMRRLGLYLLGWVPFAGILLYLLTYPGGLIWWEALVLTVPLCLVYAFICLSAWYSCRSTPLESSTFLRLSLTHLLAALLVSGLWVLIAAGLAAGLATLPAFHGFNERFARDYPLLFSVGVFLYLLAVALHYVLLSVELSREAERREIQARVLARDSELKALKAQVNPHFLFNCLNSISALTSSDGPKAREMCVLLADFLRKTLGLGEKAVISLGDELALVRSFLSVEKVRFGSRLRWEETIAPEALELAVPPLLLQPLVENAVAHGISNLTEGGWIRMGIGCRNGDSADTSGGDLTILVENNFDPEMPRRRGHGLGLENVRQRLYTRYGDRARFEVRTDGDCFRVSILLPAERVTTQ
jgi:two-component system sensor histidine kinase AlgZ